MAAKSDAASSAVQAAPSAAALGMWFTGVELQWWAALLGVIFLLLQISHFCWKWWKEWHASED